MHHGDDFYDFHIGGHDARLIKIAIKNDIYHTLTVKAPIAKTIDFTGGTRKVELIRLSKCFKVTRIDWPDRTGAIRRLFIHNADTLTKLDISALTSLEELSILDCRSLEEIIGLSDSIKEINIHNVKLKKINLSHLRKLQKINIAVGGSEINFDLSGHDQLQIAMVTTKKTMTEKTDHSTLNFRGCTSLHTLYVDTGDNPVTLDVRDCTGLQEDAILTGRGSDVIGLKEKRVTKNPDSLLKLSQDYYAITRLSKPGIHDRETIIHESGSQIEVDRASSAKITLLGMPIDVQVENSQKDLSKELRAFVIDNTYHPSTTFPAVYYLPALPFVKRPFYGIPASRIVTNQNPAKTIAAWKINEEGLMPNPLEIKQEALNQPVVRNLLTDIETKKQTRAVNQQNIAPKPFEQIYLEGDWYYIKNKYPYLANKIIQVPPAAFLAPAAGGALGLTPEAITVYQTMLLDASNFLARSMLQNHKTLSHRARNLQILKQVSEIRRISRAYFTTLARATIANQPAYDEQGNPRSSSILKNIDSTPQQNVDYRPYDGQVPLDGDARNRIPPDVDSTPIGGERSHRVPPDVDSTPVGGERSHRVPPGVDQTGINAEADTPAPPPDMHGRKAPQEPIDTPPDMRGKKAPQEPIDTPPDMRGKKAPQEPIDTPPNAMKPRTAPQVPFTGATNANGLDNVPPMDIEPTNQRLFEAARKLADAVANLTRNVEGIPDQILIGGDAEMPADIIPKRAPQTPINAAQSAKGLDNVPPMDIEPTNQHLINTAKKLADAVDKMTKNVAGLPEQILIDAEALSKPPLLHAPALAAEPVEQRIIEAAKKLADAVDTMTKNVEGMPEQILIDADALSPPQPANVPPMQIEPINQELLEASKKLANEVKRMTDNVDGLPEQILIDYEKQHHELPPVNEAQLLEASRNLANALKKMTDNAFAISSEKSSASSHAAVILVDNAIHDLKKEHAASSLYETAQDMIVAIKLLAKACQEELAQEEKEKLVQDYSSEKKFGILKILISARHQYMHDHDLLNPGLGQFGRIPGKADINGEILARFIDALSNNNVLDEDLADKEIKKLMKDSELKYALIGIKDEMRECLTGVLRPTPKPNPSLKDEL